MIAPTHLEVYGLSASVERAEDGRIAMGFFAGKDEAADQEFADNIPGYIAKFSEPGDLESAFGYLDAIRVMDVDLRYSDLQTGAKWHAPETNIELIREADGLEAVASMGLDFGERRSRLTCACGVFAGSAGYRHCRRLGRVLSIRSCGPVARNKHPETDLPADFRASSRVGATHRRYWFRRV